MATYCFLCDECGEKFERIRCPVGAEECLCLECGATAPRVFAPATIIMPSNEWCNLTRRDFLPEPEKQKEYAKTSYPIHLKKTGVWM